MTRTGETRSGYAAVLRSVNFRHVVALCIVALTVHSGIAQDQPRTVRYRRMEIPAAELEHFVKGLLPRPRAEFEELVRDPVDVKSAFLDATYVASLSGDTIHGTCQLRRIRQVTQSDDYLALGGDLAMSGSFWITSGRSRPALLGSNEGTTLVAADPTANVLEFQWRHRGQRLADTVRYHMTLPTALLHEMRVTLPKEKALRSDQGVVTRTSNTGSETTDWTIRWSGADELRFSVIPLGRDELKSFDVRQDSTYRFQERGLRLTSTLFLASDFQDSRPATLRVDLDPTLSIARVTSNGQLVRWTRAQDSNHIYVLELPASARSSEISLKIDAFGAFPRAELFELPRIRADGHWISETVRSIVHQPLETSDAKFAGCRCRAIEEGPGSSESMEFVLESETAELKLQIDRNPVDAVAQALVNVVFEENSLIADVIVRFEPLRRELFDLQLDIDTEAGWLPPVSDSIEAVTDTSLLSLPTSVVDRYQLESTRSGKRLSVRLKQAAAAQRPVYLKFRLRNDSFVNGSSLSDLMPVSFPGLPEVAVWVYARDSPGLDLLTSDSQHARWQRPDDSEPMRPQWIEEQLQEVIGQRTSGAENDLLLRHTAGSTLVHVVRRPEAALMQIESSTTVVIGVDETRQTVDIDVDPLGKEVGRVSVVFSQPVAGGTWRLNNRTEISVPPPVDPLEGDASSWTRYELSFEPIAEPFQLRFKYTEATGDEFSVPLVSVGGATSERGTVVVVADGAGGLDFSSDEGLHAIPFSVIEKVKSFQPVNKRRVRGAFAYNDTATVIPALKVHRASLPSTALLLSWRTDVRSFYSGKGRPRHRADFYLQNEGASQFSLQLPSGVALDDVEVDGEKLNPQPRLLNGLLSIALPPDEPFPCVTVRYVQREESLRAVDWLRPTVPTTKIATLQRTWQVWLPGDYRIYDSHDNSDEDRWLRRIFGPFANRPEHRVGVAVMQYIRRQLVPGGNRLSITLAQVESLLGPRRISPQARSAGQREQPAPTWGQRLGEIEQAMSRTRRDFELLVDREELRRMGIFPDSILPATRYTRWRQMGLDRLVQAGLAVVIDGHRVIFTSATEVRQRTRGMDLIDGIAIEGKDDWFASTRLQGVEEWQQDRIKELWHPSPDALEVGLQRGGWMAHRNVIGNQSDVKIYHRDTAMAFACSSFFFGYAVGWWSAGRHRRRWFVLMASGFVCALVMPQPAATLSIAFAWACLLSGLTRFFSSSYLSVSHPKPVAFSVSKVAAPLLCCAVVVSGMADPTHAQVTDTRSTEAEKDVPLENFVYLPKDREGKQSEVVYMPAEFYRFLKLRQAEGHLQPDYVYRRAEYSGDWPADIKAESIRIVANYDVTTFRRNAHVILPTFGPAANFGIQSVRVDRGPVDVDADQSVNASAIVLGRPDDYRVSLELLVPLSGRADKQEVRLPIPTLPDNQLRMNIPRGINELEIPSALGVTRAARGIVATDLGPSSELVVRTTLSGAQRQPHGVDQLLLLELDADQAMLETRFRFNAEPSPLSLKVDPRLIPTDDSISAMQWNPDTRILNTGVIDADTSIRFRLRIPTTVGRLKVPSVRPIGTTLRSSRMAVVTSSEVTASVESNDIDIFFEEEFLESWRDLEVTPSLFLATNNALPTLRITLPTRPETWNSEIAYFFSALETKFELTTQLTPTDLAKSLVTIRRFKAPSSMQIREIKAKTGLGVPLRLRWRHQNDGLVLFFLDQPELSPSSPIDIVFLGEIKTKGGPEELPLIVPEADITGSQQISQSVALYRASDVDLDVDRLATVNLNLEQGAVPERNGFRYAGSWNGEISSAADVEAVTFAVGKQASQRTLTGHLTTTLSHDHEGWSAEVVANVASSDGVIDAVHFDVPESLALTKPIAKEGDVELRVDDTSSGPGLGRRIISVWLPLGASKTTPRTISLSCGMTQEQTRLPDVRLLNVSINEQDGQPQHYVVLPLRSLATDDDSRFSWTPRGLVALPVDEPNADVQRYRVMQPDFEAELVEIESAIRPEVHLLETTLGWTSSSEYLAMSQYDLKPSNRSEVIVRLPENSVLLRVLCDDVPSFSEELHSASPSDRRDFRAHLASAPWPQRLRVMFRGNVRLNSRGSVTFHAPRLFTSGRSGEVAAVPILKELWNVYSTSRLGRGIPQEIGEQVLDLSAYDDARIASFSELWNNSQIFLREKPRDDKLAWLVPWAHRFERIFDRAQRLNTWDNNPELQTMNELLDDYPEVFDPDYFGITMDRNVVQPTDLWNESQWLSGEVLHCGSATSEKDELPKLQVLYVNEDRNAPLNRYFAATIVLAAAIFLPRWDRTIQLLHLCARYPHPPVMVLGVLWWLVLSPSWLGLFVSIVVGLIWTIGIVRSRPLGR